MSSDSGLDDSAVSASTSTTLSVPATRLSWFLAEVDEGSLQNGEPSGKKRLCVLHSMELLESDVSDKYMTRFVEFRLNGVELEAKLILASDDRKVVDAALVALSKEQEEEEQDSRHMLVQYEMDDTAGKRLVQKIISPNHVVWLSSNPELGGTPLVKLGPNCIAHVLYSNDQRDYMEKVLLHLKARCFDHVFDEKMSTTQASIDEHTWMLVQYSPEPEIIVYQVIPFSQTVWHKENLFKDVIAYLQQPDSDVVLQAIVISYSQDEQAMLTKYNQMRSHALELEFPMTADFDQQLRQSNSTAALFARTSVSLFHRAEKRDATGEHRQMRRHIEELNQHAQSEANMIIDAFDTVNSINKNLQVRLGNTNFVVPSNSEEEETQ